MIYRKKSNSNIENFSRTKSERILNTEILIGEGFNFSFVSVFDTMLSYDLFILFGFLILPILLIDEKVISLGPYFLSIFLFCS